MKGGVRVVIGSWGGGNKNTEKLYGKQFGCQNGCKYLVRGTFGYTCKAGVSLAYGLLAKCNKFLA
jgi:hypothetical protein